MKRNLFSRLERIEQRLKEMGGESFIIEFSSGDVIEMNDKRMHCMFDSIHEGNPNKDVEFFLNQLTNGYEDEGGLVHLIEALNVVNNPKQWAELWKDYREE